MAGMGPADALTVATWNIRAGIGPGEPFPPAWWRHVRRDRIERIAAVIRALDADVVALQEVAVFNADGDLFDLPADLVATTGMTARYAAAGHFPILEPETSRVIGTCLWGNAILSRHPIRASWATGLPQAADDDLVESAGALHPLDRTPHPLAGVRYADAPTGAREPRSLLRATVETPVGAVHVLTAHLTHVGGEQRRAQAAAAAEVAGALEGPLVLLGDLNTPIDAPALEPLGDGLRDAFDAVGVATGDPRRITCGPWAIDHVLTRGLHATECRVATEAGDASDHWPVVAVLTGA